MIEIPFELLPRGDPNRKKRLGTVLIWNDETGSETHGNYVVQFLNSENEVIRTKELKNFPRDDHLQLVFQCLSEIRI